MMHERLRTVRKEKGVSLKFMADKLGYRSSSGYANIENGDTELSLKAAKQIADLLGVEMEELFFAEKLHV